MPRYRLNPALAQETISPPVTLARAWASSYPHANAPRPVRPLLNLAQGVPGNDPPREFQERLRSTPPTFGYGDVLGSAKLRQAVAQDLSQVYRGRIAAEDVCITAGANLAFAVVAQSLAGEGDAIVLPTPAYFNHTMTLTSLGIKPLSLPTHAPAFVPDPSALAELLDSNDRIRAVVCVTPNNPTGAIYSPDILQQLHRVCNERSVPLVVDETYRDFLLSDDRTSRRQPHRLFESDAWRETLIHISSFSKAYAIPGHRLGSIACDPSLLRTDGGPLVKALDNLQICPPVASTQDAVAWAMHDAGQVQHRLGVAVELLARQKLFREIVEGLPPGPTGRRWKVESSGGYYAFVRHCWEGRSSETVAEALAGLVGVVILPGSFFMPPGSTDPSGELLRFSIANVSQERLRELPERVAALLQTGAL